MKKRPFRITLLIWVVLFFSTGNLLRLGASIYFGQTLKEYNIRTSPYYLAATGIFWCLVGLFIIWCLRHKINRSQVIILVAGIGYSAWYWFDRLIFQYPRSSCLFAIVIMVALLTFLFYSLFSPASRQWFN